MGDSEDDVAERDFGADRDNRRKRLSPLDWLFISGDRRVVAGVLLLGVLVVMLAATEAIGPIQKEETSPMFYLFSSLVGGNFTLITIVISVSQLVISRQLGTPGQIRNQIEATNDFREDIEQTSDIDVAPVTPTEFLHILLESAADLTRTLTNEAEGHDGEAWDHLTDAIDQLAYHIGRVESEVREADVTIVSALSVTLDTNYSADIYDLRSLRTTYNEEYTDDALDSMDTLVVRLQQIDVGRQYMKTLYMQDELSELSRSLLYVGVPALLASIFALRGFSIGFETIPADALAVYIPIAATISLAPLMVLVSYILRLTTVARRTIAITPFTMAMQEQEREIVE